MVGSHDPRDPLFDPIDAPDPKLLSDFELDAAASVGAELSAQGDLAATEYVERAKTEQKLRRSRREAEEAAAAARLEEQEEQVSELSEAVAKIQREESSLPCWHPDCDGGLECSVHSVKFDR